MRTLRRPPSRTAKKQLLKSCLLPDEKDAYTGTSEFTLVRNLYVILLYNESISHFMLTVAQLVEYQIVILNVASSSLVRQPK